MSYEDYKFNWIIDHVTVEEVLEAYKDFEQYDYYDDFEDYLFDYGFNGMIYASFGEWYDGKR